MMTNFNTITNSRSRAPPILLFLEEKQTSGTYETGTQLHTKFYLPLCRRKGKTMHIEFDMKNNTVGELMDWIKANNIPPETKFVFLPDEPEELHVRHAGYQRYGDDCGEVYLMF